MGAIAKLAVRDVAVVPGSEATVELTVRNKGTVVDQLSFTVLGGPAAWSDVDPPSVSLLPDADATARVSFRPPRSPSVPAGSMPFGVRVASQEDPDGSVVEEGRLEVAAFSDVAAELVPRTTRGSRGARHELAVENRGNARLNATLSGVDPDRHVSFRITPPAVVADAGHAAFARVAVRARRRFWRGQPQTRPFRIQVESPDRAPVLVDGALLQDPVIPSWLPRALALLALAAIAALLGWIFLLQPAVQTAAEDKVVEILGSPRPPTPPAVGPTPPAVGPTPPAVGPTPPIPEATEVPVDGRLLVGEERMPEAGRSIYITDLVFSNPNAASGVLSLERDEDALLVLQLDNFRDLDFHFVTPIVFGADERLRLTCDGTCDGAALYYSGYER